ncbi:MAG TPA: bifunctional 4-hydroxy-2-oxoglutarate aldolase/2-dehydro-3-deoxy-phosphogluconate aldolase [Aggregatilineales bacterium]|nr:bifunctional 4-hydroxy-2-oxoglutarate aldolase/2-dehydro-3-deoxy-phosphogluconate aldolase [Aggregatilineales bacterium]
MQTVEQLKEAKIVAILRGNYVGRWEEYAGALLEGGIRALEITLNSPGAPEGIRTLSGLISGRALIGAGTVLTADAARTAIEAGAQFIVAPDTTPEVIAVCKESGIPAIPGAYTPTEIRRAWELGASLVKVFPSLTPAYVKAIRGPFNDIPLMITGGVNLDNAVEFLQAGAQVVGVGNNMTGDHLSLAEITRRASDFVKSVGALNAV